MLVVVATLLAAPAARADGDPASDVLYNGRVFFPYSPPVSASVQKQLLETVAASERAGYPIRVALISGPGDLGAVTSLWTKPRKYATFLGFELSFLYKGPLLIVMPDGLGFSHYKRATAAEYRTLARVPISSARNGLALTAIDAVRALAARAGHPVPAPAAAGSSTWSSTGFLAGVGAAVALLAAAAVVFLRRRRP